MNPIKFGSGHQHTLIALQGVWRMPENEHFQTSLFGGQEMMVVSVGDERSTYQLSYMGFKQSGYETMDAAKDDAQRFAIKALKLISQSAATLEPVWIPLEAPEEEGFAHSI